MGILRPFRAKPIPLSAAPYSLKREKGDHPDGNRHYRRAENQRQPQIAQAENGVYLVVYPPQQNRVARLAVMGGDGEKRNRRRHGAQSPPADADAADAGAAVAGW